MSSSNISLIIPLVDAQRSQKTGSKATNLSKLIAARFAVPRGFVISADAYRTHLWISGARNIASSAEEAAEREKVREAILSADIPQDIWNAIAEAYQRLSWQVGITDPKVAVRSSAIEGGLPQGCFSGAYESYLNVCGLDELGAAVKRVWASLWTGKAAAFRARQDSPAEPAMAVIVQQMIESDRRGTALTADPVTGNPHEVVLSTDMQGTLHRSVVDLRDMSVDRGEAGAESIAAYIAEKAVLIENIIGSTVEVEWIYESDVLWVLQTTPISDMPVYFPVDNDTKQKRCRITERPVSIFARSLLWKSERSSSLINGYVYRSAYSGSKTNENGLKMLALWEREIERDLSLRCEELIKAKPANADFAHLQRLLSEAADVTRCAAEWLERASYLSVHFSDQLKELLAGTGVDASIYFRLLKGLPGPLLLRDARLQELGERFRIAEDAGKLNDEKWWKSYKREVDAFAREYAYAFRTEEEMCDPLSWKSWIEDTDAVFRIISAMTKLKDGPTLVTRHSGAEIEAREAVKETEAALKGKAGNFDRHLHLCRSWLALKSSAEQIYASACTNLRLVLNELAKRLTAARLLLQDDDIAYLTFGELTSLPIKLEEADASKLSVKISQRKHSLWLEERLIAPSVLPADAEAEIISDGCISGCAISPGVVTGRARVVETMEQASEIEAGEILIVKSPTLAWTPFLALAGGFISEDGPADLPFARDLDIPALTGCRGAMKILKSGQKLTLDGSNGKISLTV